MGPINNSNIVRVGVVGLADERHDVVDDVGGFSGCEVTVVDDARRASL